MGGLLRRVENVTFSLRRRLSLLTFFRRRKKVGSINKIGFKR